MVVYTGQTERTPQEVAETNAALQQMLMPRRRSSWMQNAGSSMSPREGATGNTGTAERRASQGNNGALQEDIQNNNNPNGMAYGTKQQKHNETPSSNAQWRTLPALDTSTGLVDYHVSPHGSQMPTPFTSAAVPFSRPPSEGRSRPGLPSPALSDENTNSPVGATAVPQDSSAPGPPSMAAPRPRGRPRIYPQLPPAPKRPRGRPRKDPQLPVASNSSTGTPHQLLPGDNAAEALVQRCPSRVTEPSSAMGAPVGQSDWFVSTPTSNLPSAAARPQTLTTPVHPGRSPQRSVHPLLPEAPEATSSVSGIFETHTMEQRLEDTFRGSDQFINNLDKGRKQLLLDAIQTNDLFYMVLHQMFCLYNCQPAVLAPQLSQVPSASWNVLKSLLCPNRALTRGALKWFSEFPKPTQVICATKDAQVFAGQIEEILGFLKGLPQRWQALAALCQHRAAPPLTQELVERLHLTSPVLQTTAFRALARTFWGESDTRGFRMLEDVHRFDQRSYTLLHWRRTDAEKRMAIGVLARLFEAWNVWSKTPGTSPDAFNIPNECNYFFSQPQMMDQSAPANADIGLTAQQRQQLIELNANIQGQQQTALPGLTLPLQRRTESQGSAPPPRSLHSTSQLPNTPSHVVPSNGFMAPHQAPAQPIRNAARPVGLPHLRRLLPPQNSLPRAQPAYPDTLRISLHQAHLRSPVPGNKTLAPGEQPMYRHVIDYALVPTALDKSSYAQSISVALSQAQIEQIPATTPASTPGAPGTRALKESSRLYRLRCSKVPAGTGFRTENSWMTAENVWPDVLTFQLNGQFLEPRRKLHHGRYLPIDLSPYLKAGDNTLSAFALPSNDPSMYAVAIEIIGVTSHKTILSNTPTITAKDSLEVIKRSLSSVPDEDDDIGITSSTLTIPLFDPFRADRICDVPVRGTDCLHRECFDLETFLSQCKREEPGYPSVPDCWRCPICKGDVRPQKLIKDGFLMQVRDQLKEKDLLSTRAIIVQPDGSWKPKPEEQATGVRSASLEREEAVDAAATSAMAAAAGVSGIGKGKQKVIEVIELD